MKKAVSLRIMISIIGYHLSLKKQLWCPKETQSLKCMRMALLYKIYKQIAHIIIPMKILSFFTDLENFLLIGSLQPWEIRGYDIIDALEENRMSDNFRKVVYNQKILNQFRLEYTVGNKKLDTGRCDFQVCIWLW